MTEIDFDFLAKIWKDTQGFVRVGALKDRVWEQNYLAWPGTEAVSEFYTKKLADGWDIYFNPTLYGTASKDEPLGSWVTWVDFDGNKPQKSNPPPTEWPNNPAFRVQTSDPTNQHTYWLLDKFYDPQTVELANRLQAVKLHADMGSWDFGQMLRVPGTLNFKTEPPKPVVLLDPLEHKSISLDAEKLSLAKQAQEVEFDLVAQSLIDKDKLAPIVEYLKKGEWKKDRSGSLYHIACLGYENGLADNEVATVLHAADIEVIKKWSTRWNGEKLLAVEVARLLRKTKGKSTEGITFAGLSSGVDPVIAQAQLDAQSFWDARPELQHVLTYARSKLAPPWAVLGCVLARVISSIEPNVVLPGIIGSRVSLNMFVGLVGGSSGGKGISNKVAHDCMIWPIDITITGPGSGEGLIKVYKSMDKDEIVTHSTRALMIAEEIDTLSALTNRQASTLMPELRKAYMGEQLGFSYAAKEKRIQLKQDEYRLCMTVGIQPLRAEQLLGEQDGGTPQRFIWMPTVDPLVPDDLPATPDPMQWKVPLQYSSSTESAAGMLHLDLSLDTIEIQVCQQAQTVIRDNRKTALRTGIDNLDGHRLLTQLKVATALGLLNGRPEVNDEDWALATVLMHVSDSTRSSVIGEFNKAAERKNKARGQAQAQREVIVESHKDAVSRKAMVKRILDIVPDDWMTHSDMRKKIKANMRELFDEVMPELISQGQVDVKEETYRNSPKKSYRAAK